MSAKGGLKGSSARAKSGSTGSINPAPSPVFFLFSCCCWWWHVLEWGKGSALSSTLSFLELYILDSGIHSGRNSAEEFLELAQAKEGRSSFWSFYFKKELETLKGTRMPRFFILYILKGGICFEFIHAVSILLFKCKFFFKNPADPLGTRNRYKTPCGIIPDLDPISVLHI